MQHGGHNAKPLGALLAGATFRKDRHAHLTAPAPGPTQATPTERRQVCRGLGPEGRSFAREMLGCLGAFSPADLRVLRLAGQTLDRLSTLQHADPTDRTAARLRAEQRAFVGLLKALKLER